jgi:hypothetical protein
MGGKQRLVSFRWVLVPLRSPNTVGGITTLHSLLNSQQQRAPLAQSMDFKK